MSDWVGISILATIGIWVLVIFLLRKRKGGFSKIAPDRPELPYTVFKRDYDVVCKGRDAVSFIDRTDEWHYPGKVGPFDFKERVAAADVAYSVSNASKVFADFNTTELALAILLDLSGSMADRLPAIAGELRAVVEAVEGRGASVAVFGHTTRSWRGGTSRCDWINEGRPDYPGRLADLLHVRFKEFGEPIDNSDWEAMLLPILPRENIDGEALEWMADELSTREEHSKALLVISDGASVDDSTLMQNGSGFLERHHISVIAELAQRNMPVAAIGIDHRVDRYFENSEQISEEGQLSSKVRLLIAKMDC